MKLYLLIGIFTVLGTFESIGQTKSLSKFPCKALKQSDSLITDVSGLMDHNELQIDWIKEEIEIDSVATWLRNWIIRTMTSGDSRLDSINSKFINEELSYFEKKWRDIEMDTQAGDRIYYYTTPDHYWSSLAGQDGLLIIRDCVVIRKYILMQS